MGVVGGDASHPPAPISLHCADCLPPAPLSSPHPLGQGGPAWESEEPLVPVGLSSQSVAHIPLPSLSVSFLTFGLMSLPFSLAVDERRLLKQKTRLLRT